MLRCREGDLAEIVRSEVGNERRRLVVERPGALDEQGRFLWRVTPLQPLHCELRLFEICIWRQLSMEQCYFPDSWLRPIRDPLPDVADTIDVDAGVAHA